MQPKTGPVFHALAASYTAFEISPREIIYGRSKDSKTDDLIR
jgi:hypothetical protein